MDKKLKILAAGDLHGDIGLSKKLSKKAKKEKVDLVVLSGDINGSEDLGNKMLMPFSEANQRVLFIPGNWESSGEHEAMKKFGKSIHNYYVNYGDVGIVGIGSEDWHLELDKEDFKMIKENFDRMKSKKRILVSHLHAEGTGAEFSGIPGDKILRKAVEEFKPDLLISSHIHEAEGVEDKIGKTRVVQVGKKGKILEI
jgi:Icc-related predicted phosphoesterase